MVTKKGLLNRIKASNYMKYYATNLIPDVYVVSYVAYISSYFQNITISKRNDKISMPSVNYVEENENECYLDLRLSPTVSPKATNSVYLPIFS
jgi:hypothetical protein